MIKLRYLDVEDRSIGTITLRDDGRMVASGCGRADLYRVIREPSTLIPLRQRDGERFLRALQASYRSGYVRLIYEGPTLH